MPLENIGEPDLDVSEGEYLEGETDAPLDTEDGSIPHPYDGSRVWYKIQIGDRELPGIAAIKGPKRAFKLDVKPAKGKGFPQITTDPAGPLTFQLVLQVITQADLDAMVEFLDEIEPLGEAAKPYAVYHPALDIRSVSSAIFGEITGPDANESGYLEFTLQGTEWREEFEGKGSTTPKAAAGGDKPKTVLDNANAAWDQKWHDKNPDTSGPPPPPPPSEFTPPVPSGPPALFPVTSDGWHGACYRTSEGASSPSGEVFGDRKWNREKKNAL